MRAAGVARSAFIYPNAGNGQADYCRMVVTGLCRTPSMDVAVLPRRFAPGNVIQRAERDSRAAGAPCEREMVASTPFDAVRTGSLLCANRMPPRVMPARNTPTTAKIIAPPLRGDGASHRNCLSRSLRSLRFIVVARYDPNAVAVARHSYPGADQKIDKKICKMPQTSAAAKRRKQAALTGAVSQRPVYPKKCPGTWERRGGTG
jgi:hypothetical protein